MHGFYRQRGLVGTAERGVGQSSKSKEQSRRGMPTPHGFREAKRTRCWLIAPSDAQAQGKIEERRKEVGKGREGGGRRKESREGALCGDARERRRAAAGRVVSDGRAEAATRRLHLRQRLGV